MNQTDLKIRLAAWTWAATTLGVDAGTERIRGLVETTRVVPADRLRVALEAAIQAEPSGFLPSPGAVIEQYRRLASKAEAQQVGYAGRELTPTEHRRLMGELNPDGWEPERWSAFNERLASDPLFAKRVDAAREARTAWAAEQSAREIAGRHVSHGFRIELRRRLNAEAFDVFPRPDPFEDGWVRARNFDPMAHIAKRIHE